ncbi:MAG: tRNA epoxyqueuosine(34) reductase QueG [Rhodospirillales bacterium]|nr:tRNA epoxyqueuosine(34) reductase QueG [Rhodospirillales bacterium]
MDPKAIKEEIRKEALAVGFDVIGFAPIHMPQEKQDHLREYIADGRHADMEWMAETVDRKSSPHKLWPEVKSVVVLGLNYGPGHDPLAILEQKDRGAISVYAQGKDYHNLVKKRLKRIARWMVEKFGNELKVFVDTAPIMEKPLAQMAGLGWQGKYTNVVSRDYGAWLFLGEIFTTLDLPPDEPEDDHCGNCTKCIDACPTGAITAPYEMDARACISYLNIELKGDIPEKYREAMGNRIYGCDDCSAVCPWNKFTVLTKEEAFQPRAHTQAPRLSDLAKLDDATFRTVFSGSPVKRTGRNRMLRNILIAMGNSGEVSRREEVRGFLEEEDPAVREAARWALEKLI